MERFLTLMLLSIISMLPCQIFMLRVAFEKHRGTYPRVNDITEIVTDKDDESFFTEVFTD